MLCILAMREEYKLGKLKVKRRGPLPAFQDAAGRAHEGPDHYHSGSSLVEHFEAERPYAGHLADKERRI